MSSANSDILFLPFQFVCLLSFSCWIAMARTASIKLNSSGENGYPCLNSDFREGAFSFSTFSMMFAMGFPDMAFIMFRKLPSILVCWVLLSEKDVEFRWIPFRYQLRWSYGFYHFLNIIYYIDWFVYAEPSLHSSCKFHLVMVYNPLSVLMNSVFLFRVFASIFIKNISMQSFPCPCLSLVWGSGKYWPHRMSLGILLPLQFFGIVKKIGVDPSLNVWYDFPVKPWGPGLFFIGRFLIAASISSLVIDSLFGFLISSWFSVGRLYVSRHLFIFPSLSNLLAYNYS